METATNTNLEAADEVARQLRLRDLGGLVVIDFIDMLSSKNQRAVENRLRDALKMDRARIQTNRISKFGLMEMSRQRLRPSPGESTQIVCPRCTGSGSIRSIESLALSVLRLLEEEAMKDNTGRVMSQVPVDVATYLLNEKRENIAEIEARNRVHFLIIPNPSLETPHFSIERIRSNETGHEAYEKSSYELTAIGDAPYTPPEAKPVLESEQAAVGTVLPSAPAPASMEEPATETPAHSPGILKKLGTFLFGSGTPSEAEEETNSSRRRRGGQQRSRQSNNKSSGRNSNNRRRDRDQNRSSARSGSNGEARSGNGNQGGNKRNDKSRNNRNRSEQKADNPAANETPQTAQAEDNNDQNQGQRKSKRGGSRRRRGGGNSRRNRADQETSNNPQDNATDAAAASDTKPVTEAQPASDTRPASETKPVSDNAQNVSSKQPSDFSSSVRSLANEGSTTDSQAKTPAQASAENKPETGSESSAAKTDSAPKAAQDKPVNGDNTATSDASKSREAPANAGNGGSDKRESKAPAAPVNTAPPEPVKSTVASDSTPSGAERE